MKKKNQQKVIEHIFRNKNLTEIVDIKSEFNRLTHSKLLVNNKEISYIKYQNIREIKRNYIRRMY